MPRISPTDFDDMGSSSESPVAEATVKRLLAVLVVLAGVSAAQAQILLPPAAPFGWNAGDPNTTAFHWNNFAAGGTYPGPFVPDQAAFHPGLANASLMETLGGGFLTGGGNLYSQGVPMHIAATLPNYDFSTSPSGGWSTTVYVQTRTLGNELDYAGLTLNWIDLAGAHTLTPASAFLNQELEHTPLGGFGGFAATHLWGFAVPASPSQFTLSFGGALDSVSLDQLRVDTQVSPVPEPSSLLLLTGAGLAFWRRQRRR
ncbi:MAG: PEP-CTERM sorting domain-containing protein [Gemmataceae bacterium]